MSASCGKISHLVKLHTVNRLPLVSNSGVNGNHFRESCLPVLTEWRSQYEKGSADVFDSLREYEFYSVMHYPMNAPGSNKPAFQILDAGIDQSKIGQRDGLTDLDVQKVRDLYGC